MKATGRVIVYRRPEAFRCRSTFTFDSKCGIPVSPSAEATEDITTWGTRAAFAASIAVVPWRTSFSTSTEKSGLNGVVIKKNASTPRSAGARLALSVRSPRTPSSPRVLSSLILSGFRVSPLTRCPCFTKALATDPPCCPVAPATRIVFVSAIVSTLPAIAALGQVDWVRSAAVTDPTGSKDLSFRLPDRNDFLHLVHRPQGRRERLRAVRGGDRDRDGVPPKLDPSEAVDDGDLEDPELLPRGLRDLVHLLQGHRAIDLVVQGLDAGVRPHAPEEEDHGPRIVPSHGVHDGLDVDRLPLDLDHWIRASAHGGHQGDLVPLPQLRRRFRKLVVHGEDHRLLVALEAGDRLVHGVQEGPKGRAVGEADLQLLRSCDFPGRREKLHEDLHRRAPRGGHGLRKSPAFQSAPHDAGVGRGGGGAPTG